MKGSQNLPAKLKELRKKNHYSQEQVAEKLNISRQAISNWETGKAYPDIDNLVMLSELYGASVDEMLGTGEMVNKSNNDVTTLMMSNSAILEMIGLAVVLILSLEFPFCGMIASLGILYWLRQTKRKYHVIFIMCVICFLFGIYDSAIFYAHINSSYGNSVIEVIE